MTTKFNVGQVYSMRSVCDHDCIWHYRVTRRSDSSVWLQELNEFGDEVGDVIRRKIDTYSGHETVFPTGKYSMAPVLGSDDKSLLLSPEEAAIKKEMAEVAGRLVEYQDAVNEIKWRFEGRAQRVRLESLADEYGIELLKRRHKKLSEKLAV